MLKQVVPSAKRLAVLRDANFAKGFAKIEGVRVGALERAAASLGMNLQYFNVSRPEEVPSALDRIAGSGADALWYSGAPVFRQRMGEIAAFALKQKLPSVGAVPPFADSGGLLAYAPNIDGFYDRTASYVDRILKGARPSDLPVEEPTKFNLVINLKTASSLGLTIPRSVLVGADRVIE
jgi:putative ABC transport system substrate-binding protein